MITAQYDKARNVIIIEFKGRVDVDEAEGFAQQIQNIVPKQGGFRVLTDLSGLDEMDPKVQHSIKKHMDLFNKHGVTEVIRVIPDPEKDLGFNILSIFHYSKHVQFLTVESRQEAEERLND